MTGSASRPGIEKAALRFIKRHGLTFDPMSGRSPMATIDVACNPGEDADTNECQRCARLKRYWRQIEKDNS